MKIKQDNTIIIGVGFVLLMIFIVSRPIWLNDNKIDTFISTVYTYDVVDKEIEIPIKVTGYIRYDGLNIYSADTIVDFKNIQLVEKELKAELRSKWREMKRQK